MDYKKVYKNMSVSLKKHYNKIGADRAVIGISGGLDSAVAAAVAVNALGAENVQGFYMPYDSSSRDSYDDALALSQSLGIQLDIVNITSVVDAFFLLTWGEASNLRKGNAMSRIRMTTLFDRAAACNGIVLGTANRTELLLGYGTWHGDTASSINILGNLYKKEVWKLAEVAGIPESIIKKIPSADLWPGQTDEEELGFSYKVIDDFLYALEQDKLSYKELVKKFGKDVVEGLIARVTKNRFKREMPVICSTGIKNRKKINEKHIQSYAK